MNPFAIHAPATVDEAVGLLGELDAAAPYAGGTELLLAMKEGFLSFEHLVDVKGIPELAGLDVDPGAGALTIGANVTHRAIARDPMVRAAWPLLARVESAVGNERVRTSGTIGGNLCFAEPHSDIATLCVLRDARLHLAGPRAARTVVAGDFFLGPYETALAPGELLIGISMPLPAQRTGVGYERFAVKERPVVICAAALTINEDMEIDAAEVAVAGATPTATRAQAAQALAGEPLERLPELGAALADEVAAAADVISDQEGSEGYKRQLIGVLTRRALARAADDVRGKVA